MTFGLFLRLERAKNVSNALKKSKMVLRKLYAKLKMGLFQKFQNVKIMNQLKIIMVSKFQMAQKHQSWDRKAEEVSLA